MVRAVLFLTLPAASASCVGERCPAKDSVLLQLKEAKLAKAEAGEAEHAKLQELLAELEVQRQEARHDDDHEEYHVCVSTGEKARWCWTGPDGEVLEWSCHDRVYPEEDCQKDCKSDPASCEEGGSRHAACRCADLTTAAVAACTGKSHGDGCVLKSPIFKTKKGTHMLEYKSMCHDHDGTPTCMAIRRKDCSKSWWDREAKKRHHEFQPIGAPCIYRNMPRSWGSQGEHLQEQPILSYCGPYVSMNGEGEAPEGATTCHSTLNFEMPPPEITAAIEEQLHETGPAKALEFWTGH